MSTVPIDRSPSNALLELLITHLNSAPDVQRFHQSVSSFLSDSTSRVLVLGSITPTVSRLANVLSQEFKRRGLNVPVVHHQQESAFVDDLVRVHRDCLPGIILTESPDQFISDVSNTTRALVMMHVFDFDRDPDRSARVYEEEELKRDVASYVGFCVHMRD
jgi:hypothetical protein